MQDNPFQSPSSVEFQPPHPAWRVPWGKVVFWFAVLFVLVMLLLPAVRRGPGRSAALKNSCRNSLKQIGFALQNYYDNHGSYPPAYTVDENGKPLHSWRTLLLPYLEEEALYKRIDLTKPWDDPVNAKAFNTTVGAYQCPSLSFDADKNMTTYQAVVSPQSCLRGGSSAHKEDIKDGLEKTVMVIEVPENKAVHWMSPQDADEATFVDFMLETNANPEPEQRVQWSHMGGISHVLFADGHIEDLVSTEKSPAERRAMITIAGGEK